MYTVIQKVIIYMQKCGLGGANEKERKKRWCQVMVEAESITCCKPHLY